MTIPKNAIDLFCGCGGISAGLRMCGYDVLAGIDLDRRYIATFRHNFPDCSAVLEDITKLDTRSFLDSGIIDIDKLGIIVGGPPCQGFSKNVPRKYRFLDDERNVLVKRFLDFAGALMPPILLMENVAEMRNGFDGHYTDEVIERLSAFGYSVEYAVLNAADYGIPQRRRRAFFLANLLGVTGTFPKPTHFPQGQPFGLFQEEAHVNVWDAIGDLPSVRHGEGEDWTPYRVAPFSDYQHKIRSKRGVVRNHVARRLQPRQYERLSSLEPGQGMKDLPLRLQTKGGYSGAYGRLTKNMIAPTITRWVFHPGSGRWGHPCDVRVLTIREVARIQGFPDDFEFVGSYNDQAGQLGNAVPPLLIAKIIAHLERQLKDHNRSSKSFKSSKESRSSSDGRVKVAE